jgi:hypothetical protein
LFESLQIIGNVPEEFVVFAQNPVVLPAISERDDDTYHAATIAQAKEKRRSASKAPSHTSRPRQNQKSPNTMAAMKKKERPVLIECIGFLLILLHVSLMAKPPLLCRRACA